MRRQDIQLVASARQGDVTAKFELGRRYLLGEEGFPRHIATALEYLLHPSLAGRAQAEKVIAEALPLQDIIRLDQLRVLRSAANAGSTLACVKLALWLYLTRRDAAETSCWLERAADQGSTVARAAMAALARTNGTACTQGVLEALSALQGDETTDLLELAVTDALQARDAQRLGRTLQALLAQQTEITSRLADCLCQALVVAQGLAAFRVETEASRVELLLEHCFQRGNADAALLLGRALCGIDHGPLRSTSLAGGPNLRKGAAMLLRAADSGRDEAWMHLYHVHADNRASVANPLMSRFFLEKAAISGDVGAQRRLGALTLRSATTLHESEQGISWLHRAAACGDLHAVKLLQSLVLQVHGDETHANAILEAVRRDDPWVACRLRIGRDFGLTKLEALSVDVVSGERPWGLVVGPNPFVSQSKRSAPRAIPALTSEVAERLHHAAVLFGQASHESRPLAGELRQRSNRLRALMERHDAEDGWFFADVSSAVLNSLRMGTKWAFQTQKVLRVALADDVVDDDSVRDSLDQSVGQASSDRSGKHHALRA